MVYTEVVFPFLLHAAKYGAIMLAAAAILNYAVQRIME